VISSLVYPLTSFRLNVVLIIFCVLKLNDVMTIMFAVPSQTISVLAATRLYNLLYVETGLVLKEGNSTISSPPPDVRPAPGTGLSRPSLSFFTSSRLDSGKVKWEEDPGDTTLTDLAAEEQKTGSKRNERQAAARFSNRVTTHDCVIHTDTDLEKQHKRHDSQALTSEGKDEEFDEASIYIHHASLGSSPARGREHGQAPESSTSSCYSIQIDFRDGPTTSSQDRGTSSYGIAI
jgi:hypothetical protein